MKLFLTFMLVVGFALPSQSADTFGDGWPWPWGAECPFPWTDISGNWKVSSTKADKRYYGHHLYFEVEAEGADIKLLYVEQYDHKGVLYATGKGIADGARVISTIMDPVKLGKRAFKIMVRAYVKGFKTSVDPGESCQTKESVLAVTFCPPNGKKCMETSNYTLEKPKKKAQH